MIGASVDTNKVIDALLKLKHENISDKLKKLTITEEKNDNSKYNFF